MIIYCHVDEANIDVDNMIKPILDALNGTVYMDDRLVSQVIARRTRLYGGLVIEGATEALAEGLEHGRDFVYVAVRDAPDHGRMP